DYSCVSFVYGCTNLSSLNYNSSANTDDGACIEKIEGCTDFSAQNYDIEANSNDNSCAYLLGGCTDENYLEFNELADYADGSCQNTIAYGCTNPLYLEFSVLANTNDNSCEVIKVEGCNSNFADNFLSSANFNDGSCSFEGVLSNYSSAIVTAQNLNDTIQVLKTIIESGVADPIYIDLVLGWNMIGFTSQKVLSFEASFLSVTENPEKTTEFPLKIVKNISGEFSSPEFGVNMLGNLTPGMGYLINMNEPMPDFSFTQD
ncbi:MAG: hypothetical protein P8N54_00355, partial [Flavobacteriales bacterium]|nr:hypothetical protein [Flavobacteriales bacterium]